RKTLRAYGLPFSQIAANSESIPRRGFFDILSRLLNGCTTHLRCAEGELVLPDNSVDKLD
ncbi:hypothetical protein, partial [Shewanella sp.]|uniref:hypothetical protein n=1 Tax=Shewanella sp. TaxID=50422 RepID=UPI003D0AA8C1